MTMIDNGARGYVPPPSTEVPWPIQRRSRVPRPWMPFDVSPNADYVRWVLGQLDYLHAQPAYTMSHVTTLYRKQYGRCIYCGHLMWLAMVPAHTGEIGMMVATLDHMEPVGRGGSRHFQNLVASCNACNNEKGSMNAAEYRRWKDWVAARERAPVDFEGVGLNGAHLSGTSLPEGVSG